MAPRPDGLGYHWSDAGHDVQAHAGGFERHHDIAEQDCGVDLRRRTGCIVISVTMAGSKQASSMATPSRSSRYSGSERLPDA